MGTDLESLILGLIKIAWFIPIISYVMMAVGLYTIAKKRSLPHAWMAWAPVIRVWLLGSISDHYNRTVKGKQSNRRTRLLILKIVVSALKIVLSNLGIVLAVYSIVAVITGGSLIMMDIFKSVSEIADPQMMANATKDFNTVLETVEILLIVMSCLAFVTFAAGVWRSIETFGAYHCLFCSCHPAKKKALTAWSIVTTCLGLPIVASILIFACRQKIDGLNPPHQTDLSYQGFEVQNHDQTKENVYESGQY